MNSNDLTRYGTRYLVCYVVASVALLLIAYVLAQMSIDIGSGGGAAVAVASAAFTLDRFLKDHDRLPDSREYWTLVLLSTVIAIVIEGAMLALMLNLYPALYSGNQIWAFTIVLAAVLVFLVNLVFYSRFIGNPYLKRQRRRDNV